MRQGYKKTANRMHCRPNGNGPSASNTDITKGRYCYSEGKQTKDTETIRSVVIFTLFSKNGAHRAAMLFRDTFQKYSLGSEFHHERLEGVG